VCRTSRNASRTKVAVAGGQSLHVNRPQPDGCRRKATALPNPTRGRCDTQTGTSVFTTFGFTPNRRQGGGDMSCGHATLSYPCICWYTVRTRCQVFEPQDASVATSNWLPEDDSSPLAATNPGLVQSVFQLPQFLPDSHALKSLPFYAANLGLLRGGRASGFGPGA